MKLSFVIPVFNEESSIEILYYEILENVKKYEYEIIFVDDGSTDKSFQILKELGTKDSQVKVLKFRKNFGKAAGLQSGFDLCTGDIIFTMDADLQDNPDEIEHFIEKIAEGYDLVAGWKKKRHDPLSKTLPSKLFNLVTQKTFSLKLHDYNCGFKAYKKEVIKEIDVYGEMHRYIPALAHARGFLVTEIPVLHRKRSFGKSKYGIERYIRGFLDLLTVKLVTKYTHSPLYLFGGVGLLFFLSGSSISFYLTISKYVFGNSLTNRPLLFLGVLLIMVGVQLFSVGLIGELLVNQNRKINKKSQVSIAEKINV